MSRIYVVAVCCFCWKGEPKSLALHQDDADAYAIEHGWVETPRGLQCPSCQPEPKTNNESREQ